MFEYGRYTNDEYPIVHTFYATKYTAVLPHTIKWIVLHDLYLAQTVHLLCN